MDSIEIDRPAEDYLLTEVEVPPLWLSSVPNIVNVIYSYIGRKTDVTKKYFFRADANE
ncbi:hypothetical protein M2351_005427 [Azospirillum canadense]|nr:hypothetical protein [Azospirillum canadense]